VNQKAQEVCTFERTFYVYRRGAEQLESVFPECERPMESYLPQTEESA
jgi:hypothetical protein